MSDFEQQFAANCIKCGRFCDPSLFCDTCEKNARHAISSLCKKYNTKQHRITQFLFELFVELYKCSYFVNNYHKNKKGKKSLSLQTDFSALRNSQYCVMRTFASQMSLNDSGSLYQAPEDSDSDSDRYDTHDTYWSQLSLSSSKDNFSSASNFHIYSELNFDTTSTSSRGPTVTSRDTSQSPSIGYTHYDTQSQYMSVPQKTVGDVSSSPRLPVVPPNSFVEPLSSTSNSRLTTAVKSSGFPSTLYIFQGIHLWMDPLSA